jgi:hypothetical protein
MNLTILISLSFRRKAETVITTTSLLFYLEFERADILRTKVKAIARMAVMFKNLKQNSEILLEIKEMAPDGKIPLGLLMKGRPAIKD